MKVLIVEPDQICAQRCARIIQNVFFAEVTIVSNSYDASAQIRNYIFDLLLVEINLPDLRGDMIVGFAQEGFKLGMSALHTSAEIRNKFDDFILKPFIDEELLRILTNVQFQYLYVL